MTSLFVAWRPHDPKAGWRPVGRLDHENNVYRFSYTRGALKPGFRPFDNMESLHQTYESRELFPVFANRLLSRSRPEYEDFLKWGGFSAQEAPEPLVILGVTEGLRQTDAIEVFPCPPDEGQECYDNKFFLHGIRRLPEVARQRIRELRADERLCVMLDVQNDNDPSALALRTEHDRMLIGYLPRYLTHDLRQLMTQCELDFIAFSVVRVNVDAPLQNLVLCRIQACWPEGFRPFTGEDFQPIPAPLAPPPQELVAPTVSS